MKANAHGCLPCHFVETEVSECWFQRKTRGPHGGAWYKCTTSGSLSRRLNANLCFNKAPGDSQAL